MKYFAFFVLLLFFSTAVFAQSAKLTNKDVVEMVAAGLPESVIISKIKASEVVFETDLPALKSLQQAGIPSAIVSAMVEKAGEKPPEQKPITSTTEAPEYGAFAEIKDAKTVYIDTPDIKARQIITKELASIPQLTIVSSVRDSDFTLAFRIGSSNTGASVTGNTITSNAEVVGELYAIRDGSIDSDNRRHLRIVWSTRKRQAYSSGISFSRHPATNAINQFIKELKKIRGEK